MKHRIEGDMLENAKRTLNTKDLEALASRIDELACSPGDGMQPMVVDAMGEAWRRGLGSAAAREALVLVARRGTAVVCCPLGRMDPTAPILPGEITIGMDADEVLMLLGAPESIEVNDGAKTWLHVLPSAVRDDEDEKSRIGIAYRIRQAA